jgi:hypothetical protein
MMRRGPGWRDQPWSVQCRCLANSSGLRFTVALGKSYQDTDPAYLTGLLRARRQRPSRRAPTQAQEKAGAV